MHAKISTSNEVTLIIMDPYEKEEIYSVTTNRAETLESVFLRLNDALKDMKINKIAISKENKLFTNLPVESFKKIAIKTLPDVEIILYKQRKRIITDKMIRKILYDYHVTPTGGHIGQNRQIGRAHV